MAAVVFSRFKGAIGDGVLPQVKYCIRTPGKVSEELLKIKGVEVPRDLFRRNVTDYLEGWTKGLHPIAAKREMSLLSKPLFTEFNGPGKKITIQRFDRFCFEVEFIKIPGENPLPVDSEPDLATLASSFEKDKNELLQNGFEPKKEVLVHVDSPFSLPFDLVVNTALWNDYHYRHMPSFNFMLIDHRAPMDYAHAPTVWKMTQVVFSELVQVTQNFSTHQSVTVSAKVEKKKSFTETVKNHL